MVILKIHHNPIWNLQNKVEETVESLSLTTWKNDPKDIVILYFQSIHQGVYCEIKFTDQKSVPDSWAAEFARTLLIDTLTVDYPAESISYSITS